MKTRLLLLYLLLSGFLITSPLITQEDENTPDIAMIGIWDRAMPLVEKAARETSVPVEILTVKQAVQKDSFADKDVVYILNFSGKEAIRLKKIFTSSKQQHPDLRIIPLDQRGVHSTLERVNLLHRDKNVAEYWQANGAENMRRLLNYTAAEYLDMDRTIKPALSIPDAGFYHPDLDNVVPTYDTFKQKVPNWDKKAPVAAFLIHQSFWITEDTAVINAVINSFEERGINVATFFSISEKGMRKRIQNVSPDLIIEQRHGGRWEGGGEQTMLEKLNAPYLNPISMLQYTVPEWKQDPQGLHPSDKSHFLTLQESDGEIEPVVVGGLKENTHGFKLHVPIPGRVERFADRAMSWIKLQQTPNEKKKIAVIYYNKYLGQSDLMRGSPTGGFLDAPASMINLLPVLKKQGYKLEDIPKTEEELLDRIKKHGRNIGPWAQGTLQKMVEQSPDITLIPASTYKNWFEQELSEENRQTVVDQFGSPPGDLMTVTRNGREFIVLPTIKMGNVVLAPQPVRGEKLNKKMAHNQDVPPSHNYLAFYWWIQKSFQADAMIHWGTHGTLELLPGKETGLSGEDWSDICAGIVPVINPWIMDNIGEAPLSRRRSYALLVDHLNPPAVHAELTPELENIHNNIHKWEHLEKGVLRKKFRTRITEGVRNENLEKALDITVPDDRPLNPEQIKSVSRYLHKLANKSTPMTLHELGEPPAEKWLPSYLAKILGDEFKTALKNEFEIPESMHSPEHREQWLQDKARTVIRRSILQNHNPPSSLKTHVQNGRDMLSKLNKAEREITNLLRALDGEYIPAGPGPGPVRNPSSVPSGRNLYSLNPREIPTRASWDVGKDLVKKLLKEKNPTKVGFDLNGMNTMRDFGVIEAQIFYLLGVRPVWNDRNLVVDVELISREELGRPRVDVFISMGGQYKENFPSRVKLLDKAVRLASKQNENQNAVRSGTEQLKDRLLKKGFSQERAGKLATARIFGTKPGNLSGTKILYLVPRSGAWDTREEITKVYIDNMSFVYTRDIWGKKIDGLYKSAIQGTDTLVRAWASNMTSQLSNHHAYEYLGGLSMAVKELTGKEPDSFIADVRDPSSARMRNFNEVLKTNLRTELLNKKWIRGMKEKEYAGAGTMSELVKNTFGWDVTKPNTITDSTWNKIHDVYVRDQYELELQEWFDRVNPHALQEMAATMLEASRRDYWDASQKQLDELSRAYAKSVAKHGPSNGLTSGGNEKLEKHVKENLQAPGSMEIATQFEQAMKEAREPKSGKKVKGKKLTKKTNSEQQNTNKKQKKTAQTKNQKKSTSSPSNGVNLWWILGAVFLVGLVAGIWKKTGAA